MSKKTKKIYLVVLWTVTAVVIFAALGIRVWGWGKSFGGKIVSAMDESKLTYDGANSYAFPVDSSVDSIVLDVSVANLKIIKGDSFEVKTYYSDEILKPVCEVKGNVLRVEQKNTAGLFNFGVNKSSWITIYVPRTLSSLTADSDVGNVYVEDISCDISNLSADVGNISLNGGSFKKVMANTDTGNVKMENVGFSSADLSSDVGNVKVLLADSDRKNLPSMELETSLGDVKVLGKKQEKHYSSQGSSNSLKLKSSVGNVKVE